ncbi:ABC transporter permease [Paenibacillus harenae]|uniref:ABC transporter permease n=1 Tax=Paenibacillus harenae TaxID=306543 RepID=A0ABT9TWW4_PAEHA|nr:ABC transporter permease [Paenibacillus harenae]MDQ0110654.1 hypothetical protein [Paenibacillus harenae]
MNNAQRALLIAAGLFLTIALITLVVNLFGSAQEASKQAQDDFSSMQTELSAAAFDGYDNTTMTGSQVLNALRKFGGRSNFGIQVITGKNQAASSSGTWYYNTINVDSSNTSYGTKTGIGVNVLTSALDETNPHYINPSGKFKGTVIRDKNGAVSGIVFDQQ